MQQTRNKTQQSNRSGIGWWVMLSMAFSLSMVELRADDRFPPYDNSEEAKAYYASKPEFFKRKPLAELPADLVWENGADKPEMGDPAAKKGGIFRDQIGAFPNTLRIIGPSAGDGFRGEHWDYINVQLIQPYLDGEGWVPGLAKEWAVSKDGKTMYFRLHPEATYSDGVKIDTEDYFMLFYVMQSPNIQDPWYNDYYTKEFTGVTIYDSHTFAFHFPESKPDRMWIVYDLQPFPRHFYKEFTEDFPARYQWRKYPTTGAYEIYPDGIKKGRSIMLTRVKTWWAKDMKHFRYRFNPDFIEYKVIGSADKAWEMFRQGQLDWFAMGLPRYWYDKSEVPEFYNGYIERQKFYNDFPRISRGIYLNMSKPGLDNLDVRLGISYAMNFQKVIDVDFRGDYERMQSTFAGFGKFTNPNIKARPYDVVKAREHFTKAGYTQQGPDGVLRNAQGKRLSFTFSIPQGQFVPIALRLKEEALRAGLDLNLEVLDFAVLSTKVNQKNQEIALLGWAAMPPYPRLWDYYHSVNAYKVMPDGSRKVVPDTNNITMTADPAMDPLIDQLRVAQTEDEVQRLSWQLQQMVEDLAVSIPAWESPSYRFGYWRWVKWPKGGNLKHSQLPFDTHVHWLDEEARKETMEARREGRSFGEVYHVFDQHKIK
ncbi:ABC transporter substrate-binding protein [Phragmitibacter flavus]|uniref:ABC transporter substrate-binding protein n=1 Tax=Phragmitibacter flavus TaxID=2576071 RepID=A0A5R8KM08_9BACT|nr:extracellular solute-binding protein [Phragmitibacter flavus]TLD72849.1 ABC transporter substrate-binding protein [Phragmitibacter flavus]